MPAPPHAGERHLVQVIGPKGAGKTSLLLRWRATRPGPYHYVAPGWPRWQLPVSAPIAYWDEVDRMAAPTRAVAFRTAVARGATIVVGTHRDLSRPARACGLRVTSYEFPALSPKDLQEWASLRISEVVRPGARPALVLDRNFAAEVCAAVGPSLREAAVILHRWAAECARAALMIDNQPTIDHQSAVDNPPAETQRWRD